MSVFYDDNDNTITLKGLRDIVANVYLNSATVEVTVLDTAGAEVSGQTWPTTLDYVAASNGVYRALLVKEIATTPGQRLTARITADAGSGQRAQWDEDLLVQTRKD